MYAQQFWTDTLSTERRRAKRITTALSLYQEMIAYGEIKNLSDVMIKGAYPLVCALAQDLDLTGPRDMGATAYFGFFDFDGTVHGTWQGDTVDTIIHGEKVTRSIEDTMGAYNLQEAGKKVNFATLKRVPKQYRNMVTASLRFGSPPDEDHDIWDNNKWLDTTRQVKSSQYNTAFVHCDGLDRLSPELMREIYSKSRKTDKTPNKRHSRSDFISQLQYFVDEAQERNIKNSKKSDNLTILGVRRREHNAA